jgi:hypothetical protein
MPVLKTSASDYTSFVRSAAVLPTAGKAVKSTVTTVNTSVATIVATASKVVAAAAPKTAIVVAPTVTSRGNKKGD